MHSPFPCTLDCRPMWTVHTERVQLHMCASTGYNACILLFVAYGVGCLGNKFDTWSLKWGACRLQAQAGMHLHSLVCALRPPPEPCGERSAPPQPRTPHLIRSMDPPYIALKEGEPAPAGYSHMVHDRGNAGRAAAAQSPTVGDTAGLSIIPRNGDQRREEQLETAPSNRVAKKNLARTMNRKANATFAREMKDSLAAGLPPIRRVPEGQGDLKARWHAAAKEVAYKLLDLRKEGWKGYSNFEKGQLHADLNATYKFDPPLEHKRVEKYLSGHLRTSRAVWKAHWLKYGDSQRHHNCPPEAWAKLTQWWPTEKCKEAAANMAARRARVQGNGRMGRSSLVDRLTAEVSRKPATLFGCGQSPLHNVLATTFLKSFQNSLVCKFLVHIDPRSTLRL